MEQMGPERHRYEPPHNPLGKKDPRKVEVIELDGKKPREKTDKGPQHGPEWLGKSIKTLQDFENNLGMPSIGGNNKNLAKYLEGAGKNVNPAIRIAVIEHPKSSAKLILAISQYVPPRALHVDVAILVAIANKPAIGGSDKVREEIFENILTAVGNPGLPENGRALERKVYKRPDLPHSMIKEEIKTTGSLRYSLSKFNASDPKILKYFLDAVAKRKDEAHRVDNQKLLIDVAGKQALPLRTVSRLLKMARKNDVETGVLEALLANKAISEKDKNKLKLKQKLNTSQRKDEYHDIHRYIANESYRRLQRITETTTDPKSLKLLLKGAGRAKKEYEAAMKAALQHKNEYHRMDAESEASGILEKWRRIVYELAKNEATPKSLHKKILKVAKQIGNEDAVMHVLGIEKPKPKIKPEEKYDEDYDWDRE